MTQCACFKKKSRRAKIPGTDLRECGFAGAHLRDNKDGAVLKMKKARRMSLRVSVSFRYSTFSFRIRYISPSVSSNYLARAQAARILASSARLQVTDPRVNDRRNRRVLITGQSTHFLFGRAFPDNAKHRRRKRVDVNAVGTILSRSRRWQLPVPVSCDQQEFRYVCIAYIS